MNLVATQKVREVAATVLARAGVPPEHAQTQLELLLEAELRGVPSHGLLRLGRIVERIHNGVTDPNARGRHTWRSEGFLAVDGQRGLGPVVAVAALDAVAERVRKTGIAIAAICNSNHVGMLGWYVERMAAQGMIGLALSTSEALVHPWGARRAMLGTNPVAIAVPTGSGEPFMMDIATSIVSMGEIHDYANRGVALPQGWALDAEGHATVSAEAAKSGAIAPFGQAKGYALGLAFELMVASLTGSALGRDVVGTLDSEQICSKGDIFIVIEGQHRDLTAYLNAIRALEPADGFDKVLIPGERGRECKRERLQRGLPIPDQVWQGLLALAEASSPTSVENE